MEFGFATGWERFHDAVPSEVSKLVRALHEDPAPLVTACDALPQTLLHNDVKIANIAIEGDTLWLFDWALAGIGPVGLELGWLLCVNSTRMPWTLDEALARCAAHLSAALGARFDAVSWERQRAVAYVSGLIMFGWAKVDSPDELDWWCKRALQGRSTLQL
jgi:thiamine kinase-like enzyme